MLMDEFDGFYFLPGEHEDGLTLAYFKVNEDQDVGKPVQSNSFGDMYHVIFFKRAEDGKPEFDAEFEAIFADPSVYIKNLIGVGIYGCILRKTEYSQDWWQEYVERAKEYCKLLRMKSIIAALTQIKDAKES